MNGLSSESGALAAFGADEDADVVGEAGADHEGDAIVGAFDSELGFKAGDFAAAHAFAAAGVGDGGGDFLGLAADREIAGDVVCAFAGLLEGLGLESHVGEFGGGEEVATFEVLVAAGVGGVNGVGVDGDVDHALGGVGVDVELAGDLVESAVEVGDAVVLDAENGGGVDGVNLETIAGELGGGGCGGGPEGGGGANGGDGEEGKSEFGQRLHEAWSPKEGCRPVRPESGGTNGSLDAGVGQGFH